MTSPRVPHTSSVAPPAFVPRILFVDLADRPGSDRTVTAMARLGATCAVMGSRTSFAARSSYARTVFWLSTFGSRWMARRRLRARLGKVVCDWRPDILVPLDIDAARALRDPRLAKKASPSLRALIEASLGSAETFAVFDDERTLSAMARDLGVPTRAAPPGANGAVPTLVRIVACANGSVLDGISFQMAKVDPRSGDGTVLHPIERSDMDTATRAIVAALGCTGLVSLRFALAGQVAELLSVHQGAPAAGHVGRLFGHDIHEALLDYLRGRPASASRPLADGPATIALFPNELDRDPASRALNVPYVLHDLPWDDLAMVEIYAKWLRRRHPGSARHLSRHLPLDGMPTALDLRKLVASLDRYP